MNQSENYSENCDCVICLDETTVAVFALGGVVSLISIATNSIILYSLLSPSNLRTVLKSPFLYLLLLAPFDICLALTYVMLFVNLIPAATFTIAPFYDFWFTSFRYMFALSNISRTTGGYLILVATIERYLVTVDSRCVAYTAQLNRLRIVFCTVAILCAFTVKISTLWEFVIRDSTCEGPSRLYFELSALSTYEYYDIFKVYFRSTVTIVIPFIALALLNFQVVMKLRRQYGVVAKMFQIEVVEIQRRRIRQATQMVVVIVTTYLLSNMVHVVVTIWEDIDNDGLLNSGAYNILSNMISLLSVANTSLRLPTYLLCNDELWRLICKSWPCFVGVGGRQRCASSTMVSDRRLTNNMAATTVTTMYCRQQSILRRHTFHDKIEDGDENDTEEMEATPIIDGRLTRRNAQIDYL